MKKSVGFSVLIGCVSVLCSLLQGCASSALEPDGSRVVGRSAFQRPQWAASGLVVQPGQSKALLSYRKDDVYQLELGIKQAQNEALAQQGKRFHDEFIRYVEGVVRAGPPPDLPGDSGAAAGVPGPQALGDLLGIARSISLEFGDAVTRLESVYWEEVERLELGDAGSQSVVRSYRIWVLLSVESSELSDRLSVLLDKVEQNSSKDMQKALSALTAAYRGLVGISDLTSPEGQTDDE
jgi:hypothetical protein